MLPKNEMKLFSPYEEINARKVSKIAPRRLNSSNISTFKPVFETDRKVIEKCAPQ